MGDEFSYTRTCIEGLFRFTDRTNSFIHLEVAAQCIHLLSSSTCEKYNSIVYLSRHYLQGQGLNQTPLVIDHSPFRYYHSVHTLELTNCLISMAKCESFISKPKPHSLPFSNSFWDEKCLPHLYVKIHIQTSPMPFLNTSHLLSTFSEYHILIIPKNAHQRFGKVTIKTCRFPG